MLGGYDNLGLICDDLHMLNTGNSFVLSSSFLISRSLSFALSSSFFSFNHSLSNAETREWTRVVLQGTPPPARMHHTAVCLNNVRRYERRG